MRNVGMNLPQVKRKNRSSILSCINEQGSISRKDIAQHTGLTPATVTQLCAELLSEGLLVECGSPPHSSGVGRKKVLVGINYDSRYLLAVNIGSQTTSLALTNLKGRCVCRQELATDSAVPPETFLDQLARQGHAMAGRHAELAPRLAGVSVTVPGAVDKDRGLSLEAYGIWNRQVEVCRILESGLGLPVQIENNVNAFAVAELLYGMGRQYDNLLLIKWGPGVGSAIVIDGQLYEGRHGKAAELGHFIVERGGPPCRCGRAGCLETKVSYQALCRRAPFLADFLPQKFGDAYRCASVRGEAGVFDEAIDLFAQALVNSMTILAPNRVVLFGSMFRDGMIRQKLAGACCGYDPRCGAERILYSTLADQEEFAGPAAVFAQSVF